MATVIFFVYNAAACALSRQAGHSVRQSDLNSEINSLLSIGLGGNGVLYIGSPSDFSDQENAFNRLPQTERPRRWIDYDALARLVTQLARVRWHV